MNPHWRKVLTFRRFAMGATVVLVFLSPFVLLAVRPFQPLMAKERPWSFAREVPGPEAMSFEVYVESGGCYDNVGVYKVEVVESATEVSVRTWMEAPGIFDIQSGDCLTRPAATVRLSEPLGERRITGERAQL